MKRLIMLTGLLLLTVIFAPLPARAEDTFERKEVDVWSPKVDAGDPGLQFLEVGTQSDVMKVLRYRIDDQIHTFIPPTYEPTHPLHGYTLPPGVWRIGLSTRIFDNASDFGTDAFYARFFSNVKVQNEITELDFFYGFDDDWTVRLNLPYRMTRISGGGFVNRVNNVFMSMEGNSIGIGDVTLFAKKKILDQGNHGFNLAGVLGLKLNNGRTDQQFNASQTLIMMGTPMAVSAAIPGNPTVDLFGTNRQVPNDAQPGTGALGYLFGLMGTKQFTRSALHAGVLYKILDTNKERVRPGNELLYALSYVTPLGRSDHWAAEFTFNGRTKAAETFEGSVMLPGRNPVTGNFTGAMITVPRPPFEHGTVVFFSPALIYFPRPSIRFFVSPMIRIIEPTQGPSPHFQLRLGATATF